MGGNIEANGGPMIDRLTLMETYVCVVETGSFSAAARYLEVGQPAVSKAVAQLEARLGSSLLVRSSRGLTPTEVGLNFYDGARRTIDQADEAELTARNPRAELTGRLRICAPVTFARLHIVPRLGDFLVTHPDLKIDMVFDDRHIDLMEHGIDLALRLGELNDASMPARKIVRGRRVVIGTSAYFAAHGTPAEPADLVAHEAVLHVPENGDTGKCHFRRDGIDVPVVVSGRLRVTATEGMRAAVLAGLGLTIAPAWLFAPELASGVVTEVLRDWTLPHIDLWAVYSSERLASARARAFLAYIVATINGGV